MEYAGQSFVVRIKKSAAMCSKSLPVDAPGATAPSAFPATLWTVVQQARSDAPNRALEALHTLCIHYQRAIHAWFQRSRPPWIPPSRAEEWAQDFLLFMQDKNPFRRLERRESRFRSFLVSCLRNFLRDRIASERAAKRGGDTEHVSIAEIQVAELGESLEEVLDAEFARAIHERTLARVENNWGQKGKAERYAALKSQIVGSAARPYEELAVELGLTANHVKKIMFDLREAYYETLRDEVAQIVPDRQTLEDEMRYLIGLIARDQCR